MLLVVSAVSVFAFYLAFQHVYVVFLATYGGTVAVIVVYSAMLALRPRDTAAAERIRREVVRPLFLWAIAFYGGSSDQTRVGDAAFASH